MTYRLIVLASALIVSGCASSPLTDSHIVLRGAKRGDIPRDGNGEPILDRVKPIPSKAIVPPAAVPPR